MSDVKGGVEQLLIQIFRNIDKTKIHFDFLSLFPVCAYEEELLQAGSSVKIETIWGFGYRMKTAEETGNEKY